jgi:chromosome segregation ATPase
MSEHENTTATAAEETTAGAGESANGHDMSAQTVADRARQALREVQEETERRMRELMDRGESYGKESLQSIKDRFAPAVRLSENILSLAKENTSWLQARAKDNAAWLQDKIEETVKGTLSTLHLPTAADFEGFKSELAALAKKVEALGKLSEVRSEVEGAETELGELKVEVGSLRDTVNNLARNLGVLEQRLRKLVQSKTGKRVRKGTKPETSPADDKA